MTQNRLPRPVAVGLTTLISFPPSLRLQPRLTWVHGARVLNCRSARKKRNQERQGRAGVKRAVGSHLEPQGNGQCDSRDRGKHRRCDRSKHCTAKERSPPGKNKRKIGEPRGARSYFERVRSACLLAPTHRGPNVRRPAGRGIASRRESMHEQARSRSSGTHPRLHLRAARSGWRRRRSLLRNLRRSPIIRND